MSNSHILQNNNTLPYEHSRLLNLLLPLIIILAGVVRFGLGGSLNLAMQVSAESAAACIFAIILWRINPFVAMFFLLSLWASHYPVHGKSSYLTFNAIMYGMVLFAGVYYIGRQYNIEMFLNGMCLLALANVALMVAQGFGIDPLYTQINAPHIHYVGFMAGKNYAGAFLVFCLPAFLRQRWIWAMPIILVGALVTGTFGPMACLVAGVVFLNRIVTGKQSTY